MLLYFLVMTAEQSQPLRFLHVIVEVDSVKPKNFCKSKAEPRKMHISLNVKNKNGQGVRGGQVKGRSRGKGERKQKKKKRERTRNIILLVLVH